MILGEKDNIFSQVMKFLAVFVYKYCYIIGKYIMSSIIDNDLFQNDDFEQMGIENEQQGISIPLQLIRHYKIKDPSFLISENEQSIRASKKIALQQEDFLININANKLNQRIKITVFLLQNSAFYRAISKQCEILMLKQLIKRMKEFTMHGSIYVHQGRLVMLIDLYFIQSENNFARMNKVFSQVILKNILCFQEILGKYLKIGKKARREIGKFTKNDQTLMYSRILNTTQTNFQISDEKSQFKYAKRQSKKQEIQLRQIKMNIQEESYLQNNVKTLFRYFTEEIQSGKIVVNFDKFKKENYDNLRNLLLPEIPKEKKVEDYLYNVIDIHASEKVNNGNPIGQGGVCSIFAMKIRMSFVNNKKDSKQNAFIDKIVAVKILRQDMQRKKERINHQNQIISKFSNSTSYYLPKYYSFPKMPDYVLMQRLVGVDLDDYVDIRNESISLWTKISLLINVVKGIRHLVSIGIVHLDLKPINILVCKFMITKIIDFGEAYHPSVCQKDYSPGFTFPYVAPEVFQHCRRQSSLRQPIQFNQSQDVYAFGIILSQILFKSNIFNLSQSKFQQVYLKNEILTRHFVTPEKNAMYGQENQISILMYVISRCIDPQPSSRPRFQWINIILELIIENYFES